MTITETRPAMDTQDATPAPLTVNLPSGALRELVTVAVAAGKDDTLPTLTGIRIDVTADAVSFAATDRYRLAVVEYQRPSTYHKPGDKPDEVPPFAPWSALVPAKALVAAAKALPKGAGVATLSCEPDAGRWGGMAVPVVCVSDWENQTRITGLIGEFPNYRALIPADTTHPSLEGGMIRWNVSYMADVAKLPHVRNTPVAWSFYGDSKPAVARTEGDHTAAMYLLMPVRKG